MADDEKLARRRERYQALEFLKAGGVLLREEIGGSVGVRWGRAHRSGPSFSPRMIERLREKGWRHDGKVWILVPADDSSDKWRGAHQP